MEQKYNRMELLENKIGLPDSKVIEELDRYGLNKISSKRKGAWITDRLKNSINNHKCIENKKQKRLVCRNNFLLNINTLKKQ